MSWPPSDSASPQARSKNRARVGAVLLVLAMLLWSAAAGVFVQVLWADSDPYAVGTLTALAAALSAAALTAVGGWCTRGAVPHRRFLVGAVVVPARLLSVVGAHSR